VQVEQRDARPTAVVRKLPGRYGDLTDDESALETAVVYLLL
jgi:hypothetical protein